MDPALDVTAVSGTSVVIATYERPELLRIAVRSALLQTLPPVEVIVVGDACGPGTGAALAALGGPLRYVNLPVRCGEQAIPNSVGAALAVGDRVAFLNHDDVWLPDHLEVAAEELRASGRRWHIGAAAFSGPLVPRPADGGITFTDRTVGGRSISTAFTRANRYLEPVSSWVVERRLLERVGHWRPAHRLYRSPTQDLALRLWRRAGEPSFSETVTVLKIGKVPRMGGEAGSLPGYRRPVPGLADLERRVAAIPEEGGDPLRAMLRLDAGWSRDREPHVTADPIGARPLVEAAARRVVGRPASHLYRWTGLDVLSLLYRLTGTRRGQMLERMLQRRMGEPRPPGVDPAEMIAWARSLPSSGERQQDGDGAA